MTEQVSSRGFINKDEKNKYKRKNMENKKPSMPNALVEAFIKMRDGQWVKTQELTEIAEANKVILEQMLYAMQFIAYDERGFYSWVNDDTPEEPPVKKKKVSIRRNDVKEIVIETINKLDFGTTRLKVLIELNKKHADITQCQVNYMISKMMDNKEIMQRGEKFYLKKELQVDKTR